MTIDYEAEVKKVYPMAKLDGDMDMDCDLLWWVEIKNGERISDTFYYEWEAWRSAYEMIKGE